MHTTQDEDQSGEEPAVDDAELVRRIVEGDSQAEEMLIQRYSNGVWAMFAKWKIRGAIEAADLYQETWRAVLEKIRNGDIRKPESIGSMVVSTARFVRNNVGRAEGIRQHVEVDEDSAADPSPPMWMQMDARLRARMVTEFLRSIPSQHRNLLFLFLIAEHSRDEVCQMLGITRPQLWRRLYDAKAAFRTYLHERMPRSIDDE